MHPGGVAESNVKVDDLILEVNEKDTRMDTFVKLLPKDKTAPIQLRMQRQVERRDRRGG